jgi:hypothetical protein
MGERYTKGSGRDLYDHGVCVLEMSRANLGNSTYHLSPVEATELVERIVRLLNEDEVRRG